METIFTRRSIRKYTDEKVSDEQVEKLLKAGMAAPSAGNEQPWHFIVLTERDKMVKITDFHQYANMLNEAPVAIMVCGDTSLEKYKGYWVQDCSAATQNILLAAEDEGLGAVWLGVYPIEDRIEGLKEMFDLPETVISFCVIAIGHPAEEKEPADRYNKERVHYNQW